MWFYLFIWCYKSRATVCLIDRLHLCFTSYPCSTPPVTSSVFVISPHLQLYLGFFYKEERDVLLSQRLKKTHPNMLKVKHKLTNMWIQDSLAHRVKNYHWYNLWSRLSSPPPVSGSRSSCWKTFFTLNVSLQLYSLKSCWVHTSAAARCFTLIYLLTCPPGSSSAQHQSSVVLQLADLVPQRHC